MRTRFKIKFYRMKVQRELYLYVSPERLSSFTDEIQSYATGIWSVKHSGGTKKQLIELECNEKLVGKAFVTLNEIDSDHQNLKKIITNIYFLPGSDESIDKYNNILMLFYREIIEPYKKDHPKIVIAGPSSDIFDPVTVMSEKALEKLKTFCMMANKTGSIHPADQEEWFGFICQTVDDNRLIDVETLREFLQDESYWKEQWSGFDDEVINPVWDEKHAQELVSEYEMGCELLQYYKRTQRR